MRLRSRGGSGCRIDVHWSRRWDSNPQPAVYKTAALPIELRRRDFKGYRRAGLLDNGLDTGATRAYVGRGGRLRVAAQRGARAPSMIRRAVLAGLLLVAV